jgi:hypothetical protein
MTIPNNRPVIAINIILVTFCISDAVNPRSPYKGPLFELKLNEQPVKVNKNISAKTQIDFNSPAISTHVSGSVK